MVVIDGYENILWYCSTTNFKHIELHCPNEFPKRISALAFPKRSRLVETISRVSEFLHAANVMYIRQSDFVLVAKNAEKELKAIQQPKALDFQAISILLVTIFVMFFIAFIVLFVERKWKRHLDNINLIYYQWRSVFMAKWANARGRPKKCPKCPEIQKKKKLKF